MYKEIKSSRYLYSQIFTLSEVDYICLLSIAMLACVQDCLTPWSTIEHFGKQKNPFVYNTLFANECTFGVVQGIVALELTSGIWDSALSSFTNSNRDSPRTFVFCRIINFEILTGFSLRENIIKQYSEETYSFRKHNFIFISLLF